MLPILTMLLIMTGGMPVEARQSCGAANTGQVACMDGRLCRCDFQAGGSLAGRADGHAWDCGALRPDCAPQALAPQTLAPQTLAPDPAGLSARTPPIFVVPVVPGR